MARSSLVIGYGNQDRQDDGVAYEMINTLRRCLGQQPLVEEATGLEELGANVDSVFVSQLGPELVDVAATYDQIIFVDAHVHPDMDDVYCTAIRPTYASLAFTHHMTPGTFLALLRVLHRHEPAGFIVSVRGHSFGFQRGLSLATAVQVAPAVNRILCLTADRANSRSQPNETGGLHSVRAKACHGH